MLSPAVRTLEKFLSDIGEADCEFLSLHELDRFPAICCGMANGDGGWVVIGVIREDEDVFVERAGHFVSPEQLLRPVLRDLYEAGFDSALSFHTLSGGDGNVPVVRVASANWRNRPACLGGVAYRRVEGVEVVSAQSMRVRMALDALETSRDDYPVRGFSVADLNRWDVASFREAVTPRRPLWEKLSEVEFLKRALVLDEAGTPTRAGQLLLGEGEPVRASPGETAEPVVGRNLWSACTELLPRLAESVSGPCFEAIRECFLNALIHADYDAGFVTVERDGAAIVFSNPGLPRAEIPGESVCRNYRLMRMFTLAGLARGEGKGLEIVRGFDGTFRLRWDALELRTVAELSLEIAAVEGETCPLFPESRTIEADPGWMPVLQKERSAGPENAPQGDLFLPGLLKFPYSEYAPPEPEEKEGEEKEASVPLSILVEDAEDAEEPTSEVLPAEELPEMSLIEEMPLLEEMSPEGSPEEETPDAETSGEAKNKTITEGMPEKIPEETSKEEISKKEEMIPAKLPAFGDAAHELEKYVTALKNSNGHAFQEETPALAEEPPENPEESTDASALSKVRMVRDTPRLSASIVQEAILELCTEYRTIAELATLLSRSAGSLRRHYLTTMVQDGLLELEFPEQVGRPDQRYRIPSRKAQKNGQATDA